MEIQTKRYYVNLPVFICVNLLSWNADSGQLYVTIQLDGAALKLRATSHSCYIIRCVRLGHLLGLAGPHFRPDQSASIKWNVVERTSYI